MQDWKVSVGRVQYSRMQNWKMVDWRIPDKKEVPDWRVEFGSNELQRYNRRNKK